MDIVNEAEPQTLTASQTLSAALVEGIRRVHELHTELEQKFGEDGYFYNDPKLTEEEQKEREDIHTIERLSMNELMEGLGVLGDSTNHQKAELGGPSQLILYICHQCKTPHIVRRPDMIDNEMVEALGSMKMDMSDR